MKEFIPNNLPIKKDIETKIDFLVDGLGLHRETASKYLKEIESIGILKSIKIGRGKYSINVKLFDRDIIEESVSSTTQQSPKHHTLDTLN
jgi:hypothetical protein